MTELNLTCRRCSECSRSKHHWIDSPVFTDGDDPEGDIFLCWYVCKHCDSAADDCENCFGTGTEDVDDVTCTACGGCGVIEITDVERLKKIKAANDG